MLSLVLLEPGALAPMVYTLIQAKNVAHDSPLLVCQPLLSWLSVWFVIVGWQTYMRCLFVTLLSVSFASSAPNIFEIPDWLLLVTYVGLPALMLWSALHGLSLGAAASAECRAEDPGLCAYADGVVRIAASALVLSVLVAALLRSFQEGVRRTQDLLLGTSGPAAEAIVAQIAASRPPTGAELPADAECAVCLGSGEPAMEWRRLGCGHFFHLRCMEEWLSRAQHCPLCRFDLRKGYLDAGGSAETV